jgi:hypothetical protein
MYLSLQIPAIRKVLASDRAVYEGFTALILIPFLQPFSRRSARHHDGCVNHSAPSWLFEFGKIRGF